MQELALLLTGLAGAASAAAFTKFPRGSDKIKIIGSNPRIQSEISSMRIERDVLTKTISRLYQNGNGVEERKRGMLLGKYQHQLGVVLARIEKLELASKHPDMGPVGDGLVTLMDQKLSNLDQKLYDISAKISAVSTIPEVKEKTKSSSNVRKESRINIPKISIPKISKPKSSERLEITTLTSLSERSTTYQPPTPVQPEHKSTIQQVLSEPKIQEQKPVIEKPYRPVSDAPRPEIAAQHSPKTTIPEIEKPKMEHSAPEIITESRVEEKDLREPEIDLGDTDDLDKLKKDIMKTLEKLDQAEVE